jgi:hypothetical protein
MATSDLIVWTASAPAPGEEAGSEDGRADRPTITRVDCAISPIPPSQRVNPVALAGCLPSISNGSSRAMPPPDVRNLLEPAHSTASRDTSKRHDKRRCISGRI